MDEFNKKLFCANCKLEKEDRFCNNCQQETPDLITLYIKTAAVAHESLNLKQKRPGFNGGPIRRVFSGYKPSADYPKGVNVEQIADREKNEWHHIVKDNQTGEIIHEEHELLSEHKSHSDFITVFNLECNDCHIKITQTILLKKDISCPECKSKNLTYGTSI